MRKAGIGAAAILVAAAVFFVLSLPPAPTRLSLEQVEPEFWKRIAIGAYHIHTTRSDGAGDKAAVAAAAARAGLHFAIFTDHGDATRPPDPPLYLSGVLCIDGVEISTNGGHLVALDLPAAPYPLAGEAPAVVEDVRRLGGFAIAAHPDSPKPDLAWRDWEVPVDGLEWINADSEWRNESFGTLARVLAGYAVRPGPALASLFDRPSATLDRWDALSKQRRVVVLAAVDAHGGSRSRTTEEGGSRWAIGPSYEASFRSLTNRVMLAEPLTGEPSPDARRILDAIRRGDVYSVVDAISPDAPARITADEFSLAVRMPEGASLQELRSSDGLRRHRVEYHLRESPGQPPVPWILTNWIGEHPVPPETPLTPLDDAVPLGLREWRTEQDPNSSGRVSGEAAFVTLEYRLHAGERSSQFVAAAADLDPEQPLGALAFRGRATVPMRVSVQLRFPPDDSRWVKSVYLDPEDRDIVVRTADMGPAEGGRGPIPAGTARSVLFVVDLVNASPGSAGAFTISDLRALRSPSAPR